MLRSLLVTTDLTPASDRVLDRLPLLPLAENAQITLLHVVPKDDSLADQRRAQRDARHALALEVRRLRDALPSSAIIDAQVAVGSAAKEIRACARNMHVELIVMGRGGGRPLRDAFLGSTAERVVRQTKLPVLVVRLRAHAKYHRPALALDFDEAAPAAVRLLFRMFPPPRPEMTIVHAFHIPYDGMRYPSLAEERAEYEEEFRLDATRKLAMLVAKALARTRMDANHLPAWKTYVRNGSPRSVVEKAMKKLGTDLLVLGTHGHSGATQALLGTVAGDLLRWSLCDVLVVPPARASR